MILLAAQGKTDKEIAADLGIWRGTVARWRARFIADGLTGIEQDETRPERKPKISERKVKTIVALMEVSLASARQTIATKSGCASCGRSRSMLKDGELHLIADNYATHKHPEVKAWSSCGPVPRRMKRRVALTRVQFGQ